MDLLDDAELFARVAAAGDAARLAQAELYRRHVRYLYGVLVKRQSRLLAVAGMSAEDLVQEAFRRAFERAATFTRDGITDEERLRRRVRAWLGRIAQNILADRLRTSREVSASPYLERVTTEDIDEAPSSTPQLRLLREALSSLSEREQDVLRVTALYQKAGEHQRLPNAVSQKLAQRWDTSSENVRAIRSRAIKKVKSFMQDRSLAQEEGP
jgi:RNA polymerase sigma factor (sigma-70 family)